MRRVVSAAFSPDGSRIVTASDDKTARVWNAVTGALIAELKGHADYVDSAAFSPNGSRIVTASVDKTARVWRADSGALIAELKRHGSWVVSAAFSPDGSRIVTASVDTTARVWRAATGVPHRRAQGAYGFRQFRRVQPGRQPHRHRVRRHYGAGLEGRHRVLIAELKGHGSYVHSAAFSPDGSAHRHRVR